MRARVPEVELGPLKGRGKCGEEAVRVCFVRRRFPLWEDSDLQLRGARRGR